MTVPSDPSGSTGLHVVLVEPEIPQNTGNIARTCVAVGAALHLVRPLGFCTGDRFLRRAGLEYWQQVELHEHDDLAQFLDRHGHEALALFSAHAERLYTAMPAAGPLFLLFGRESVGLPRELRERFPDRLYRLPMRPGVRSLNLASTATVVIFEALRQRGFPGIVPGPAGS